MQPQRVFVFTGLSSCLIHSLLILSLLAGSLSTVPTASPADETLSDNATSPLPLVFPEGIARPYEKEKLQRTMRNDSELYDMQHTSVSKAKAAVDPEDGNTSVQNSSAATNTSTDDTAQALTTMSSVPNIVTSPATTVATYPSSTTTTVTTSTSTTTPITHETVTEAAIQTTTQTTASQTDTAKSVTAETLTEDSGMPTGIVALVTMITFGIIAVVGYVSLIVWRRYLEYRYGNRELLVNDLEFDTNDLRHFEL